jgi:hypothetical protein
MKKSELFSKIAAFAVAVGFGLLLLCGQLSSSDFPRGLYSPPFVTRDTAYWSDFADLNPNIVWNYHYVWAYGGDVDDYLGMVARYGMKSVLRWGDWNARDTLYWVNHYGGAQYDKFEVELDSNHATAKLDSSGLGYCFFVQREGGIDPLVPSSWHVSIDTCDAGVILEGPRETADSKQYPYKTPRFDWPAKHDQREFLHRIRARATTDGVDDNTTAFKMYVDYYYNNSNYIREDSLIVRAGDFDQSNIFQVFSITTTIDTSDDVDGIGYKIYWPDSVDLWVDWVEVMDMDRAYYLFVENPDSIKDLIVKQCDSLENPILHPDADVIAGWAISDEPIRSSFRAHYAIYDTMSAAGLQVPQTPFREIWPNQRVKTFATVAQLPVLICDKYVFYGDGTCGDQSELNELSDHLERSYQESKLHDMDFQFLGQVFAMWDSSKWEFRYRHQERSEILVEAFMALAHGAEGINFYKYRSKYDYTNGDSAWGLVDPDYNHSDPLFARKWQAVHDVFTQLDSIGDVLLSLERDTAYCARDVQFGTELSPIDGVIVEPLEDAVDSLVEVGQFDSAGVNYLIVVNRHTEGGRHISIFTEFRQDTIPGGAVLMDVYTQEKFISSTGNFSGFPFEAGQGRVFRLSDYRLIEWSDHQWLWPSDTLHVLADTFLVNCPDTLDLNPPVTIKSTKFGKFLVTGYFDCGEKTSSNEVIFKPLEEGNSNRWVGIEISNLCTRCHVNQTGQRPAMFYNTRILGASKGLDIRPTDGTITLYNTTISDSCWYGLYCTDARIVCQNLQIGQSYQSSGIGAYLYQTDGSIEDAKIDSSGYTANYCALNWITAIRTWGIALLWETTTV